MYSTCNYNPSTNMTKQLKTIEILNPSKSATCSMWRYPESAKIFQYRGMDFDGFRVIRVNIRKMQYHYSWQANQAHDDFDSKVVLFHLKQRMKLTTTANWIPNQYLIDHLKSNGVFGHLNSNILSSLHKSFQTIAKPPASSLLPPR